MSNASARPRAALFVVLTLMLAVLSVPSWGAKAASAASCDTGTNLALNKTATASSLEGAGYPASAAVDGNTGTRWSSQFSDPQWLEVDLGSTQSICEVVLNWETASGKAYQIQTSTDGTTWTPIYSTASGPGGTETLNVTGSGRYIRMYGTARNTGYGYSLWEFSVYGSNGGGGGTPPPPTGGSLGSNVVVFSPSMTQSSIQATLNSISDQQVPSEFGTGRYELLFEPGTYGSAATPLIFTVGYYEAVAGLGRNPGDVTINGTVDSYNQCSGGTCNATTNFWRSLTNLTINVMGMSGCQNGDDFWAVSQAAPMRRVHVNGNLSLMDYCVGGPGYSSGGFIADSQFTGGTVTNGSQQQYITRDSALDGWSNGVWNQVFCGDPGAPAQSFASNSGLSGGPPPYTTLATCPVTREAPYLYQDSGGNYNVFVPSLATNSSGPTWTGGQTPGTSLSLNTFFVVQPSATVDQINAALAAGDNLLFAPGVYNIPSTIDVTRPDTQIVGLGFATLVPTGGNTTLSVADVSGVTVSGLIFDAGATTSPSLLQVGTAGSTTNHSSDPVSLDDVFFRVGGATAGSATTPLVDDSNDSLLDDVWIWRADHGAGAGTWSGDQSPTGLVVNGARVTSYGLAVEHFQQNEVDWNGQSGTVVFFQNENPYEVPNQAAWMASASQKGYPALFVPNSVTSFQGYGLGSYSYFDQGADIHNAMAFQVPQTSGVQLHDLLTVFLNGSGGIDSVVNGTGKAVSSAFGGPSDVVSYP
ncbi:discoidin domain-containing protein [Catenulispora sp. NL8]|uniref:Discoidin domain-containing protein n=1 Tax=Catenulispora pinistramenti TaxID=2705254 RepID=A0ABS5KSB0_9ACTN|nr:discoidin domain-containing protein [Catenulispora pinistramenti]MBS2548933.1 discoidin domain-containing protein [Catenulispora pinistramenti]